MNPTIGSGRVGSRALAVKDRISLGIVLVSGLVMITIGGVRLLKDGSLWLDEASIADNLLRQTLGELFGPLLNNQHFPRLYLVLIAGLVQILGYHTLVLRILPYAAFVLSVCALLVVVFKRFRHRPELVALAVVLSLIPATHLAYSAMLKQYSLDVLLALVPFLWSDAFLDRRLREGRGRWQLLLLVAPCLFSFTYPIPLLGRLAGWYAWGKRRGEPPVKLRAAITLAGGLVTALAGLWLIDLRHTAGTARLESFWASCIPQGDWPSSPAIVARLLSNWYTDQMAFGTSAGLPSPVITLLLVATGLGCAEILRRAASRNGPDPDREPVEADWGSRSLGCLVCVLGLIAAGFVAGYPLCAGRLTLFAVFPIQMLALEGIAGVGRLASRQRAASVAFSIAVLGLVVVAAPTAHRRVHGLVTKELPENVRPLLHHLESRPELPILVAPCSGLQVSTLPEWRGRDDILYYAHRQGRWYRRYPKAREFFVLSAGSGFYCPWFFRDLEGRVESSEAYHDTDRDTASLVRVVLPEDWHPEQRRRERKRGER